MRLSFLLSLPLLYTAQEIRSAHAFGFDAILPGDWQSVRPEDMSFFPNKFSYNDDYNFLKSLGASGTPTRPGCTGGEEGWKTVTETLTDASGKSVELSHRQCINAKETPVDSEETTQRLKNAQYILRHISEGSFPAGFTADKLVVGKRVPYSGDWYSFYSGSTLSNPNSTAIKVKGIPVVGFGVKKFQNRDVHSFAPTSADLLKWSRNGTLTQRLEEFPTPIIIDILNGKTDPAKSDFYEFTGSEQKRIRSENTSVGSIFKKFKFRQNIRSWTGHGMCESWSAAAINEPRPTSHRIQKNIKAGSVSGTIEFTLSAETVAAANAIAYNRLMFFDMNEDLQKTDSDKQRANTLQNDGYVRVGEQCGMEENKYLDFMRSTQFNSKNVSKHVTKSNPSMDSKSCLDLNFGLLTIVAMNKLGVFADLFFADFNSDVGIWHYPVAGAYLEDVGPVEKIDSDAAYGTKTQRRVNLYLVHAKPHAKIRADDDFRVRKYPGRLDLSENGRILGGRAATADFPDYIVDVRRPDLAALGSPLAIIKWIEEHASNPNAPIVLPDTTP